jgi:hypothetical protein
MPNKFHRDAFPAALSVCENVFEQQVSKFSFQMTQQRVGVGRRRTPISHHAENSSRARGMDVLRSLSACGVTHVNPLPCIIMHTQDAHTKTCATAFFSARRRQCRPASLCLAASYAHTISYSVYIRNSRTLRERDVFATPFKFGKCVPQGVYFCAPFLCQHKQTRRMDQNLLIKHFRCRIMATILGRTDFQI